MASASPAAPAVAGEELDASLVLALVNTLYPRPLPTRMDKLLSYQVQVDWAKGLQLVSAATAEKLLAEARRHPIRASAAAVRLRALREVLHATIVAMAANRSPAPAVLDALARTVAVAHTQARLVPHERCLRWVPQRQHSLDDIAWHVARAAQRLLTSPGVARLRVCAADDCGWWFVDDTKNRSRRWCDMSTCGNRAKLRRFRARHNESSPPK